MAIIGGNSFQAISSPTFVKTQVLGLIMSLDNELYRLVECESGFNAEARGKAGEIGLFQYMPKTWIYFNQLRGTNLDIYSPEDQLSMTLWAWSKNYQEHWTCYKIIN